MGFLMKSDLLSNKDFLSGLLLIGTGAAAIFISQDYPVGSTLRMGPGYFPIALGIILIAFGIYTLVQGLRTGEKVQGNWSVRALILLPLSMVVFGLLVDTVGLIPALLALVFVSAAGGKEFKFLEVLIMAVILTAGSVGLFIYGLGLPYPLLKGL